jgi:hypothetical protein
MDVEVNISKDEGVLITCTRVRDIEDDSTNSGSGH